MSDLVKVTVAVPGASFSGDAPPVLVAAARKLVVRLEAAAGARRTALVEALAAEKSDALVTRARELLKRDDQAAARRLVDEALILAPEHRGALQLAEKLKPPAPPRRRKGR